MKKLVNFVDDGNILIPKVFGGIDINNVIASTNNTYTATEDCYVRCTLNYGTSQNVFIDDVSIAIIIANSQLTLPLKKGQTIRSIAGVASVFLINAFGIKYN